MKIKPILESILIEASLSRIWQHIQNGKTFAVISAYRGNYTEEENRKRHNQLKTDVRALGHGFIEQKSGYTYTDPLSGEEGGAEEKSLFIPNISKADAVALGRKYTQESILWKDDSRFVLLFIADGSEKSFATTSNGCMTFDANRVKDAYSELIKSKRKNSKIKFSFILKELRVPSREDAYRAIEKKEKLLAEWIDVL
jgi:hypothetical protein